MPTHTHNDTNTNIQSLRLVPHFKIIILCSWWNLSWERRMNETSNSIIYKFVSNKDKRNVKIGILFPTLLEKKKGREPC